MSFLNLCKARFSCFKSSYLCTPYLGKLKVNQLPQSLRFHKNTVNKTGPNQPAGSHNISVHYIAPTNFQKRILVWVGKYKKTEEVPDRVTIIAMDAAYNRARIKTANYMVVFTLIGCVFMAYSGRKAQERGESVTQMNLDWHKEMNRRFKDEEEKKRRSLNE